MTTAATVPGWQRGFALEDLKRLAAVFKEADKPYIQGAFTAFKEREVAQALADETLLYDDWEQPTACLVAREVGQRQPVKDFTGEVRADMLPGDVHVKRMAWLPGHEDAARSLLQQVSAEITDTLFAGALWVQVWQESPEQRALLRAAVPDAYLAAVKIPASSELIGVYCAGDRLASLLPHPDYWGLRRLRLTVPPAELDAARAAVARVTDYADHYSGYNKRHAWSAVSLRGFGDAASIVKPAEMSKAWKAANADLLDATCEDTSLRPLLPELEPLIAAVPGRHQRIRLMRLEPGGGELTRHADIIDREAGTAPGKVLRIHLPIVTNPQVEFSSWDLDGRRTTAAMAAGQAWYLDTRKPHTAINRGDTPRIHLVIDTHSSPALLALLGAHT